MLRDISGIAEANLRTIGRTIEAVRVKPLFDREAFIQHYNAWLEASCFDSLPVHMRNHDSYRAIVQMGERIVPAIAAELRRNPSFLFLALEDITGHDPVPEDAYGNLKATVDAWLAWLRK
ncbi:MAG: hypothetical protein ABIQ32_09570 [Sphingomicrobium sp.]